MNRSRGGATTPITTPITTPERRGESGEELTVGKEGRREDVENDRSLADFDRRFGLDRFDPGFVRDLGEQMREQARHVARGPERLAAYLAAPPDVQADFDRRVRESTRADTEAQRVAEDEPYTPRQFEAWLMEADDA